MDGSSRQVVVNTTIEWPNGITLDFANRFVQQTQGLYLHQYRKPLKRLLDTKKNTENFDDKGGFRKRFLKTPYTVDSISVFVWTVGENALKRMRFHSKANKCRHV